MMRRRTIAEPRKPLFGKKSPRAASFLRRAVVVRAEYPLAVAAPYRLDLTVSALRRLSSNSVDIFTAEARYMRALRGARAPIIVTVEQKQPDELKVRVEGDIDDHPRAVALAARMLGIDRDLAPFYRGAARVVWLHPLAERMRGIKPPRYPTLWEACVNAVTFQQISLHAAGAILRRLIDLLEPECICDNVPLRIFPPPHRFLAAGDAELRGVGLSAGKISTLRRCAQAIEDGTIEESSIARRPSAEAILELVALKGIGVWTATIILLRGFGRLDVFPGNDSGVAQSLGLIADSHSADIAEVLEILGEQRGMLYFHLLLARLEARGEIGRASSSERRP